MRIRSYQVAPGWQQMLRPTVSLLRNPSLCFRPMHWRLSRKYQKTKKPADALSAHQLNILDSSFTRLSFLSDGFLGALLQIHALVCVAQQVVDACMTLFIERNRTRAECQRVWPFTFCDVGIDALLKALERAR